MINIYVANIRAYNEGELLGEWISLPCSNLGEQIQDILIVDEEFAIHDYECDFMHINEYDNPYRLNEIAIKLSKLSNEEQQIFKDIFQFNCSLDTSFEIFENKEYVFYSGVDNDEALGEYLIENGFINVPEYLESYIDLEALGRDWSINYGVNYSDSGNAIGF